MYLPGGETGDLIWRPALLALYVEALTASGHISRSTSFKTHPSVTPVDCPVDMRCLHLCSLSSFVRSGKLKGSFSLVDDILLTKTTDRHC